ncbi:MAG: 3-oxoacyl-ACP reductase FabG [Oscillospiraceae bacterium]|nr:3-oxoacyl-ACP reductase FabG [Oscillospiraceae bacterium]
MKKTALVTGGSRGIGAATALALAKRGWTVHVNYRKSEAAAHEIAAQTGGLAVQADVADLQQVERMFAQTGPVSLLVNNAGIAHAGLLTDITPDAWQRLFDVNVTGMYHCCRCAIPHMVHEKSGQIVNLASILGTNGGSCEVAYSATKGAVIALTKALAKELGPSGIRVNCIAPGCIDTDMIRNLTRADKDALADATAMCRLGTPQDVAEMIALLAEDGARFVTGQVIGVDGGLVI